MVPGVPVESRNGTWCSCGEQEWYLVFVESRNGDGGDRVQEGLLLSTPDRKQVGQCELPGVPVKSRNGDGGDSVQEGLPLSTPDRGQVGQCEVPGIPVKSRNGDGGDSVQEGLPLSTPDRGQVGQCESGQSSKITNFNIRNWF
jgi:hypothetical protein